MKIILYLLLLILLVFDVATLSATTIQKYAIAPLNRLTMKFDKLPDVISSELSSNKLILTINLGVAVWTNEKEFINSNGVIRQASLSNIDNNVTLLTLSFTERRGYTICKLPFSQSIVVDVFDWNKLNNTPEEAYRLALLSMIDGVYDVARTDLLKAINGDVADAATLLGLIQLSEGKINSALQSFKFAEIKGSTIVDNFAALSQIYSIKNDTTKSNTYTNAYKNKTGELIVPVIEIPPLSEINDVITEPCLYIDSVVAANEPKIEQQDTLAVDTSKMASVPADTSKVEGESIWQSENYLLTKYVIGTAIAIILFIVYLYLKWRNKQLIALQKVQTELSQKSEDTPPIKDKTSLKTKPKKVAAPIGKVNFNDTLQNQLSEISVEQSERNKQNKIFDITDTLKDEDVIKSVSVLQAEIDAVSIKSVISNYEAGDVVHNTLQKTPNKRSANIELADRLANEQKRIKSEKLANIGTSIELDPIKISEIAKNLGVERGSVETKQSLNNLSANSDEFAKLSVKFGMRPSRDKKLDNI